MPDPLEELSSIAPDLVERIASIGGVEGVALGGSLPGGVSAQDAVVGDASSNITGPAFPDIADLDALRRPVP